jgi:PRTRC genetic system protein C
MKIDLLERQFRYNNQTLPDPNPKLEPGGVVEHYATLYPELTTCTIEGPELKGKRRVYTFVRRIGTKG